MLRPPIVRATTSQPKETLARHSGIRPSAGNTGYWVVKSRRVGNGPSEGEVALGYVGMAKEFRGGAQMVIFPLLRTALTCHDSGQGCWTMYVTIPDVVACILMLGKQ